MVVVSGLMRFMIDCTCYPRRRYSKVPRLVYQIMKDKQLKMKLKEYHLPTHGDRQVHGVLISVLIIEVS